MVRYFQRKFRVLKREGDEDLLQECLTHWYFKRDQHDSTKPAACKTYMSKVVENKIMDILESTTRHKRKLAYQSVALEDLIKNFDSDDYSDDLAVEDENLKAALKTDIKVVLLRAIEKLSHRQQKLCRLIQDDGLNLKQASERLNIPRTTLYEDVFRIREIFREEGLKDYL